ncbi:uncharacterized protein LOC132391313 isoform X3 [Hypanus sabinus]|uniref:uncharacterized protein LOC132391313 isoform X3 n=1 Tax=Hypanus sabinus TaxID=79690 RepID=UPI0028C3F1C2|nr:uncharacterized protein LOC132391313 isoform X3 [Hypanus sabinus]
MKPEAFKLTKVSKLATCLIEAEFPLDKVEIKGLELSAPSGDKLKRWKTSRLSRPDLLWRSIERSWSGDSCLCTQAGVPQLKAADLGKAEHFQLRGHELLYEQRDIISCDACDSIAQHLRQAQKSGSEVKTLLEKGCNSLSGTQPSLCENFVQSYKKELSKLLQKSQEEKDICRELDLCVRKQTKRLLGENECTCGPAQWCKDRKTADKCHKPEGEVLHSGTVQVSVTVSPAGSALQHHP